MNEQLLQYIWQFQHFDKQTLTFENGDEFQVIHPGKYTTSPGASFLKAIIKINGVLWVGNVAVNLKASDLLKHADQGINYDNVVMHVVWLNDLPPTDLRMHIFSLGRRVSHNLLGRVQHRMNIEGLVIWGQQGGYIDEIDKAPEIKKKEQKNNFKVDARQSSATDINASPNELKVISHLHDVATKLKTVPALLQGKVRSIKTIAWNRQTTNYQVEYGGYCKHVPKILLLGNWLADAGFPCNEKVQVIPLNRMLIIVFKSNKKAGYLIKILAMLYKGNKSQIKRMNVNN